MPKGVYLYVMTEKRKAHLDRVHEGLRGKPSGMKEKGHSPETKQKMRISHLGKLGPNKGKKMPESMVEKTRIRMLGENNPNFGKPLSPSHKHNLGISLLGNGKGVTGSNHPAWKGGVTSVVMRIRTHPNYHIWRLGVFTRDNFTCQLCGVRGGKLEADHFPKKFSLIVRERAIKTLDEALLCEEFWDIGNGRTLCYDCHRIKVHKRKK